MARLRKNRWLPDRNRASSTRSGVGQRREVGQQVAGSAGWSCAWVRMCTSSPICTPWAASANTSIGPGGAAATRRSSGPATSRRNSQPLDRRRRLPPEPGGLARALVDRRRRPGCRRPRLSTTNTGADGPMALAIGTTVSCWLAGSSRDLAVGQQRVGLRDGRRPIPRPRWPPASSGAAGRRRRPSRSAGPQCSSIRPDSPGTTSPAGADPHQQRHALCPGGAPPRRWPRRSPAARRPVESLAGRATRSRSPSGRDPPVDVLHRAALVADRLGEQRQADVDHRYVVGQRDGRSLACSLMSPPRVRRCVWPARAAAARPASSCVDGRATAAATVVGQLLALGDHRWSPRRAPRRRCRSGSRRSPRGSSAALRSFAGQPPGLARSRPRRRLVEHRAGDVPAGDAPVGWPRARSCRPRRRRCGSRRRRSAR